VREIHRRPPIALCKCGQIFFDSRSVVQCKIPAQGDNQMSLNRLLLCVLACALVFAFAFSFAGLTGNAALAAQSRDAKAQTDQEVLKINADCNAAELRGDIAAMNSCETDDFTHTHANGTVEYKAEYLKGVGSGAHKFLTLDMSDLHVRSYGTAAIVEGHIHLRANNRAESPTLIIS